MKGYRMERSIPQRLNLFLASLFIALHLYVYYFLPLFGLDGAGYTPAALLVLTALLTPQFWSLIHDAGHGVLFKNRKINNLFGRVMSILFGSNFKLLQFGHTVHHGFNRSEVDRTDIFDKTTQAIPANLFYYAKITFALYLGEVLMPLLFLLPKAMITWLAGKLYLNQSPRHTRVYEQITGTLLTARNLRTIRIDAVILVAHFSLLFTLYSGSLELLALFFPVRGFMVSFLDNIYHYGTPKDIDYSYNLKLPAPLSAMLLHFNYHRVHHIYPNVPWNQLPQVFEEKGLKFDKEYGKALFNQLRGPVYS